MRPPSRFFHASASLQRKVLGAEPWARAYTFALVRNPYARQVSMFHFLLGEASCHRPPGSRPAHCELRKLPASGPWLRDPAQAATKFRAWLADMRSAFPPGSKDAHLFGSRSHGNENDGWFNASQVSWLVGADRTTLLVRDVIRLEELEASWHVLARNICGFSRLSYAQYVAASVGSMRRNPSTHVHYSKYYDEASRRIVDEYMGADLRAFGYTFEKQPKMVESTSPTRSPAQPSGTASIEL